MRAVHVMIKRAKRVSKVKSKATTKQTMPIASVLNLMIMRKRNYQSKVWKSALQYTKTVAVIKNR